MATTKYFREKYNLTQKGLSDLFGIPLGTIKNWEARECVPDYIITMMYMYELTFEKMCKYRDCIQKNLGWGVEMFSLPDDM